MPVEQMYIDSMLGTFRNMLKECEDKKATGDAFEKMKDILSKMEQLAIEMDDLAAYSGRLTSDNLFVQFSNSYGEVLAELAKKEYSAGDSDEKLLQHTLKAYEDSITNLKDVPHSDLIIPVIQQIIEFGHSGVSYPVFLRVCEEKGWYKAMEGSMVTREGLLSDIKVSTIFELSIELNRANEILKVFDEMAARSAFGVPDATEFSLERIRIYWKYAPAIAERDAIILRYSKFFELLKDWIDSYCSFATYDERWASVEGMAVTLRNIRRCKECTPGIFKVREKIFKEYFGLTWDDVFSHETYLSEYKARRIWYSDESIDLIKGVYPYCKPFSDPPAELVNRAEIIYREKKIKRPDCFKLTEENKQLFIQVFGQTEYDRQYGEYNK